MIILAFFVYLVCCAVVAASSDGFYDGIYKWGIATLLWLTYLKVA